MLVSFICVRITAAVCGRIGCTLLQHHEAYTCDAGYTSFSQKEKERKQREKEAEKERERKQKEAEEKERTREEVRSVVFCCLPLLIFSLVTSVFFASEGGTLLCGHVIVLAAFERIALYLGTAMMLSSLRRLRLSLK